MSNTDTSKEVHRIVVSAIQAFTGGTNMFTAAAIASEAITHLPSPTPRCKFCLTTKELATCFDERMAASCPERTPSQVQVPTTAALTEAVYAWVNEDLSIGAKMTIGFFLQKLIDRLTGAPAPAPTTDRRKIEDRRGTATEEQEREWMRAGMVKKRVGKIERRAMQQDSPDRFAPNELTAGDTP